MRLLVLGGTAFLSRAVAVEAVRLGHDVTCACRGSARVPEGARHLPFDRAAADASAVLADEYDAVVDVGTRPSWVRSAVAATRSAHWVYVSTISVYADAATTGGTPGNLPVVEPITEDVDLATNLDAYGGMKVACEEVVRDTAASSMVVRPGLIVGPGDRSGRFTYWPVRLADPGPVLVPAPAEAPVQVIDVRDLGAWLARCAEKGESLIGTLDGVGEALDWGTFVARVADGVGSHPELVWVDADRLLDLGVHPWAGPGSLPVWLPRELAGTLAHDPWATRDAGLVPRPLADTARDTLAWARNDPGVPIGGITRDEERQLLAKVRESAEPGP